jgi:iron complex transport system ATP-binding protein
MSALLTASRLAMPGRLAETSLALDAGQLTCLIGPNGSGKTSLLHALAGIGTATGEVRIEGIDPRGLRPGRRQRLFSYLSASRDIKWPLKAADLVALGLPDGCDVGEIASALELGGMMDRRVDQLSTGERSRVLIARALAADPRVLLLDEPIANLDPLWQLKLMDYLRHVARTGNKAVLLAVHDLEAARSYADRLIIMNGGRIEADGDPQALLEGPDIPAVFGIERSEGGWRPAG